MWTKKTLHTRAHTHTHNRITNRKMYEKSGVDVTGHVDFTVMQNQQVIE